MAQLLYNRGLTEPSEIAGFLDPALKTLHPPVLLGKTHAAAELIASKIRDRRPIVIYGDYDVDGIAGTAILWHLLRLAGAQVSYYVPHRLEEGYGLNAEALRALRAQGADTVISVDCGITAIEEARVAREIGLTLVITDHHCPGPALPEADCLVHPCIEPAYPNPDLCGAGVAFKLAWAVAQTLSSSERVSREFREFLISATALAAMGTIADVVPLLGENRVIARHGLVGIKECKLLGVQALIAAAKLDSSKLESDHVGFWLAPRLNAAGRMGHALQAVELLTTADGPRAAEIAGFLEAQNRRRQAVERDIFDQACTMIEERKLATDARRGIVLAREGWHAGVIGIVASRVVERYGRPTVLIALENGMGQGSARSIRNFEMHTALAECAGHLTAYGGHAMAGGLRIQRECVEPFTEAFVHRANQRLTAQDLEPVLRLDAEVSLADLTEPVVRDLQRLGPHGQGNPRPRFATGTVHLDGEPRLVGKTGDHLQFSVSDGRQRRKAIFFRGRDFLQPMLDCRRFRVAFEPILNEFNGRTSVELQVLDIRFASE
jgi:single-stranded-DNA-specific exonuclease